MLSNSAYSRGLVRKRSLEKEDIDVATLSPSEIAVMLRVICLEIPVGEFSHYDTLLIEQAAVILSEISG